ncbi:MAG: DUF222 domain-containing protein [Pseudonocardia sp.]
MTPGRPHHAHRLLTEATAALETAADPAATDTELISVLTIAEGVARQLDRLTVTVTAALTRRGALAERGYRHAVDALHDLLGMDRAAARRRVTAAEQVCPRVGLDGQILAPRLAATAAAFTTGTAGLRHVEVIAAVLGGAAADRLTPPVWAGAEADLAEKAALYTPAQLREYGRALVDQLDADGPEPDDPPPPRNELTLTRHRDGGGSIKATFEDTAAYDAIATVLDAKAAPQTAEDTRTLPQRQADALAEVCGYVLDHGELGEVGGRRPHLNVIVRLEDLENRARAGCLDLGGTLTPAALRMLACDCAVVPIVLGGAGQPLDVGRATRTIPDGLRRAVAARDRGCAHPGCHRPPSWAEVHHIQEWARGGPTAIDNCVMVCRLHHRMLHYDSGWTVRIHNEQPEFIPPPWICPQQIPRRKPRPHLVA